MKKLKKGMTKKERKLRNKTVKWNLVNSGMAGLIFFVGSVSNGDVTWQSVLISFVVAVGVAANKFQEYWKQRGKRYIPKKCDSFFNFI